MMLPIDGRNAPFKPKYIDEETPMLSYWTIFGTEADGTRTLIGGNCGSDDIFVGLSDEQAVAMVAARQTFCNAVLEILNAPKYRTIEASPHGAEERGG